ncbi:recombinase family protein [Megasphaera sp. DISK 18]|uniref:recombinase family protein n=1 Tax=Megasphaera sp. DISK 18 TaxID=1776081 RepID=UPI000806F576|nr:recombinase family protein [Megasphaera sp. DISK 18]OBZ32593.1 recombinase [Megasphaera sp. DISK 18]
MKKVQVIPATLRSYTKKLMDSQKKRRVAGYARVSTDHDEQLTSYEAQVDYYTRYIQSRNDWEFVGMYTDEGISATNTKHRKGFKRMIDDAMDGKIDLIITKSVSRFARNTVDSLTTVRKLKDKGIEIYFEKENIWTLDAKGELLITIMSSLAQEESRSISENVTWGHRKRFADGKVSLAFSHFLGYDRGMDGNLIVNKKQAEIVKLIYRLYLSGYTFHSIAKELTERKIPTPAGCKIWRANTIRSILMNEKYKGDALLQKKITVDFLTKETKKNEGEVPQYYVEHNHEAIISPQIFDWVQEEIKRRRKGKKRYSGVSIFSSKIKCGQCGGWYGAKVWHSTDKYRRTIYRCNDKFKSHCKTPHLTENEIKGAFIRAVNQLIENKEDILSNITMLKKRLTDTASLEKERDALELDLNMLTDQVQQLIAENAQVAQDQDEYGRKYNGLVSRYEETKKKYDQVCDAIQQCVDRYWKLDNFMKNLQKQNLVYEFDERLWCSLVDFIIVYSKVKIQIVFKNGTKIHVGM